MARERRLRGEEAAHYVLLVSICQGRGTLLRSVPRKCVTKKAHQNWAANRVADEDGKDQGLTSVLCHKSIKN